MDAQIQILGGTDGDFVALGEWLQGEDELRGRIRAIYGAIGETELGPVVELMTVALGAGGAGTVLASSLKTWVLARQPRRSSLSRAVGRSLWISRRAGKVAPLLEQILKAADDG